jgi:hypothetical protein
MALADATARSAEDQYNLVLAAVMAAARRATVANPVIILCFGMGNLRSQPHGSWSQKSRKGSTKTTNSYLIMVSGAALVDGQAASIGVVAIYRTTLVGRIRLYVEDNFHNA